MGDCCEANRADEKCEDVGNIVLELRALRGKVELAQEAFDGLSVKLGDALKPVRPVDKDPSEEAKEDTDVSPLSGEIRAMKGAVARLVTDIGDVAYRLDL